MSKDKYSKLLGITVWFAVFSSAFIEGISSGFPYFLPYVTQRSKNYPAILRDVINYESSLEYSKNHKTGKPRTIIVGPSYARDLGHKDDIYNFGVAAASFNDINEIIKHACTPADKIIYVLNVGEVSSSTAPIEEKVFNKLRWTEKLEFKNTTYRRFWILNGVFNSELGRIRDVSNIKNYQGSENFIIPDFENIDVPKSALGLENIILPKSAIRPLPPPSEMSKSEAEDIGLIFGFTDIARARAIRRHFFFISNHDSLFMDRYIELSKKYPNLIYILFPLLPSKAKARNDELNRRVIRINNLEDNMFNLFYNSGLKFVDLSKVLSKEDYSDFTHLTKPGREKVWKCLEETGNLR